LSRRFFIRMINGIRQIEERFGYLVTDVETDGGMARILGCAHSI